LQSSGFVFLKFTKPDDERDLQATTTASQAFFTGTMTISYLAQPAYNTDNKVKKLVMVFAFDPAVWRDLYLGLKPDRSPTGIISFNWG